MITIGWNAEQLVSGEGIHNATQWVHAFPWLRVGYFNDINSYGYMTVGQGIVR